MEQASGQGQTPRIFLGLVIHNHQPVGNFPSVFASAYEKAYLPMVSALERHPAIKVSLHYSGPLIDWLLANRAEFLPRVAALVRREQVEIVGGGYYEPILPIIPDSDKAGQIQKMAAFCTETFGSRPGGLWLAERVWEPSLPLPLARAGVEWTVVDDTHFKMVGLDDEDLYGYYLTEEQGQKIKVFGTSKFLRYAVPFKLVEDVLGHLRQHASADEQRIIVMGDDGEKYGVWPQTYEHCWGDNGWIERFFNAIEENASWLTTVPAGKYASGHPASGRIYLPCASYDEMMEWALPPAKSASFAASRHELEAQGRGDVVPFMKGGFWRHFLVKYPEINWMHKKMLRVHEKVARARTRTGADAGLDHLWQAQCNCPYWHGVFGGIYLADIRAATYQHLVEAEKRADLVVHGEGKWLSIEEADVDLDGQKEILIDTPAQSLAIRPAIGGAIEEWDLHKPAFNLLASLARRPEAYHKTIGEAAAGQQAGGTETIHAGVRLKDPRVARLLSYDSLSRLSLVDHFLDRSTDLQAFAGSYKDAGDFAGAPYEVTLSREKHAGRITLRRDGSVASDGSRVPVRVSKTISFPAGKAELSVAYELTNIGQQTLTGIFGVEWNINLLGGGHNDQAYYEVPGVQLDDAHMDSAGTLPDVETLILGNRYLGIRIRLQIEPRCEVWRFPVETVSNSEGGLEGLYQASCVLVRMPFSLEAGGKASLALSWEQLAGQ